MRAIHRPWNRQRAWLALLAITATSGCAKGAKSFDELDPVAAMEEVGGSAAAENGAEPAACGNGIVEGGESCDSGDLDGESCESLGHGPGPLSCDPLTCTFDTQLCERMTPPLAGSGG